MTLSNSKDLDWESAAESHVGKVREINEDSLLNRPDRGLWVVADGMGGHAAGDVASRLVIETLAAMDPPASLDEYVAAAKDCLTTVNHRLLQLSRQSAQGLSGTTVAALLAYGEQGAALWVGDSRVYQYRGGKLLQLSRDHSQLEEWIAHGLLERSQSKDHPASNVITRAVGAAEELEADIELIEVHPGDTFLICSDGLYNELNEREMALALNKRDCADAARQLLQIVLSRTARDNISVIVAHANDKCDASKTIVNPAVSPAQS